MKVAVLEKVGQISLEERAIPEIRDDEMLIRVLVCGTCMSEGVEFNSESEVGRIFLREALTLLEEGKLDAKPMITHKYSFKEINQAFVDMKNKPDGYIKGYVRIGEK